MERTPQTHYWVGGTDQKEEGKWLWSDGNPWNFSLWAKEPRQPDNHYPGENCLKIYDHVTPDGWNDDVCRKDHKFVCSQRICQNLKDDTSPVDGKNVPILFTALSSGLREGVNGKKMFSFGHCPNEGGGGGGGGSTHARMFWPFYKKCIFRFARTSCTTFG